jgi:hypothetical protein
MEPIYDGLARRARAALGVTAWGCSCSRSRRGGTAIRTTFTTPRSRTPTRRRDLHPARGVGLVVGGGGVLRAAAGRDGAGRAGAAASDPARRDGIRFIALGGVPGAFSPSPWTEAGGPWPTPQWARASMLDVVRPGDEESFARRTAPRRPALHQHCYRMLGSLHDADDAMQETMLRAWRAIESFEPRASPAAGSTGSRRTSACG